MGQFFEFIKPNTSIDFVGVRKIAYSASIVLIIIGIISLVLHNGPRYGIDFAGGTLLQLKFNAPVESDNINKGLETIKLNNSTIQRFGEKKDNEYLIRTDKFISATKEFTDELKKALKASTGNDAEIRRVEIVGPQVGKELQEKALFAIFFSLLFTAIYISGRFELQWLKSGIVAAVLIGSVLFISQIKVSIPILIVSALIITLVLFWWLNLKYAMGAIVSLIHDVTITIGMFSIFDKEFTIQFIAALLTIIGYSLNDTIVIFDRIRENIKKSSKMPFGDIINRSVNETLGRTILTNGTILFTTLCLLFFGGGIIHDFAFAMTIGAIVGTYSSVYVASPILLAWEGKVIKK